MRVLALCLTVLGLIAFSLGQVRAAKFMGLGDLPGGAFSSEMYGLSSDGRVVIGWSAIGRGEFQTFRWTEESGMVEFDLLAGNPRRFSIRDGLISAISADGSVLAGPSTCCNLSNRDGFRWTAESGMVFVGVSPDAMSADGEVIVGTHTIGDHDDIHLHEPIRWTPQTGIVYLARGAWLERTCTTATSLDPCGLVDNLAAVSADGKVIVGRIRFRDFVVGDDELNGLFAFRWTEETGPLPLLDTPGRSATAVSEDGSVIVGRGRDSSRGEGFRWTEESGAVDLGFAPSAMSGDGSVILGGGRIWDAANGVRSLRNVFINDFGLDLTGWALGSAVISADARVIAGNGTNPAGNREVWIAIIPEPSSGALAVLGLFCLLSRLSVRRCSLCST